MRESVLLHQKNLEARDFPLQEVQQHSQQILQLEQTFVALSQGDFQKVYQRPHRVKDPKCPRLELTSSTGQAESFLLFKDHVDPWRRLKVINQISTGVATHVMTSDQHYHPNQATGIYEMPAKQQLADSGTSSLSLASLSSVATMEEYRQKLTSKDPREPEKGDVADPGATAQPSRMEEDEEDDGEEGDGQQWAGSAVVKQELEEMPSVKPKKLFPALQAAAMRGSKSGKSSPGSKSSGQKLAKIPSGTNLSDGMSEVMSAAGGSSQGGAEGSERAEDPVMKHVNKLSLVKVLAGEKYKLSLHHATDAKPKLTQQQQIQLGAHLKLGSFAAKLAPASVCSVPIDELKEAVEALTGHIQTWPVETQVALFSRQIQDRISFLKGAVDDSHFDQFWEVVKPYVLDEATTKKSSPGMDLMRLKLSDLSITAQAKCDRFKAHVFEDIVLQEVLAGESRSSKLAWLCRRFREVVGSDLQLDIAEDSYVDCLFALDTCMAGLESLLATDAATMLANQEQVETLRALMKESRSTDPAAVVAVALVDVGFWSERLSSHGNLMKAMGVQKPNLSKATMFLKSNQKVWDDAYVKSLTDVCRCMAILQDELPQGCVQKLCDLLSSRLESIWPWFQENYGKHNIGLGEMQSLLQEASICFPLLASIPAAQGELAEMMLSASAERKLKDMLCALQALDHKKGTSSLGKAALEAVLRLCREAQGVEMSKAQTSSLVAWWHGWAKLWHEHDMDMQIEFTMRDLFGALQPWMPKESAEEASETIKHMKTWMNMRDAYWQFSQGGEDVSSMLKQDLEKKKLANLMRSHLPVDEAMMTKGWKSEQIKNTKLIAQDICKQAGKMLIKDVGADLDRAMSAAQDLMAPEGGTELWNASLTDTSTWEEISEKIGPLLKLPRKDLDAVATDLQKAPLRQLIVPDLWQQKNKIHSLSQS